MKCPNCSHDSGTALLKCSACGTAFERAELETLAHLEYLLAWLDERSANISPVAYTRLRDDVAREIESLRGKILPPPAAPAPEPAQAPPAPAAAPPPLPAAAMAAEVTTVAGAPPAPTQMVKPAAPIRELEEIARELALVEAVSKQVQGWLHGSVIGTDSARRLREHLTRQAASLLVEAGERPLELQAPPELNVVGFALQSLPQWGSAGHISKSDQDFLRSHLKKHRATLLPGALQPAASLAAVAAAPSAPARPAAPASAPSSVPAAPARPKPSPPPKPARPPIDWSRVWERAWGFVVSGALLRALLYLGAFMIVVAEVILVVNFWEAMPLWGQVISSAALPVTFYFGGFLLRSRLKLPIAGGVITGIGAVLVAVALIALYRFGGLVGRVNVTAYWLAASAICTGIYVFTAWRIRGEFFAHITLLGLLSTALALASVLGLPLEWRIAAAAAAAVGMIAAGVRLRRAPEPWTDVRLACCRQPQLILPATIFLAFVLLFFVPGDEAPGQAGIFGLAAVGYGLLAWYFPRLYFAHASVWGSVGAAGFALSALALPGAWFPAAAAALAPPYLVIGQLVAAPRGAAVPVHRRYLTALYPAGFGLLLIAGIGGGLALLVDWWAGTLALALAALVLAWCAYLFQRPAFVLGAAGPFVAPFTLGIGRWLVDGQVFQWGAWLIAAWAGLALAYLGGAALLRRADRYGRGLSLWAHLLAPLALIGLAINYGLTAARWFNVPSLAALGAVLLLYLASAWMHDRGRHPALSHWVAWLPPEIAPAVFLWPIGLLAPVGLSIAWWGSVLPRPWLGPTLAMLALAYVGLGQLLRRRRVEYRPPWHAYAYLLIAAAIAPAIREPWPLMTALCLAVAVLGTLAFAYRRVAETAVAAALFFWPFQIALGLSPLTPHAYSLAYALLASLAYLPLGLRLDRVGRRYALPVLLFGYAAALFAVLTSLLGRFEAYPLNVPWIGLAVPLIVTGNLLFSLFRFRQAYFAWAAAVVFALAFGQALTLFRVRPEYDAVAWIGLAAAYMLIERTIRRVRPAPAERAASGAWAARLRWPLGLGAIALGVLGLALTNVDILRTFVGLRLDSYFPLLLALTSGTALTLLAARLYHSRWPLFLEPALAFFPVTVFFIGYGERIFGRGLTPPEHGLAWSGLGLAHLAAAALLDRRRERYAHGLYLGGYALAVFAALWTVPDPAARLWSFGLALLAAAASAVLVHFNRHRTWTELIGLFFGEARGWRREAARDGFLWVVAWSVPVWGVLLLRYWSVADGFYWLGLSLPAAAMLGLALLAKRVRPSYAWPLHAAAQFYVALGLLVGATVSQSMLTGWYARPGAALFILERLTAIGFILVQGVAVAFYAASARVFGRRAFAHLAAWLSFVPFTLAWIIVRPDLVSAQFGSAWSALGLIHLCLGVLLDRARVRYAHGPYLFGYLVLLFAVAWSLPDQRTLVWTLGSALLAAAGSAVLVHFQRHRTWDELIGRYFGGATGTAREVVRGAFLWFAAWSFPVWSVLLLRELSLADGLSWLGFGVPALILLGLGAWLRRVNRTYPWPFYAAAQFYTALGLLVSASATLSVFAGEQARARTPLFGVERLSATGFALLQAAAVAFYAASARLFRRRGFAHLAAWLTFVPYTLLWLLYGALRPAQFALAWMGLAAALLALGFVLDHVEGRRAAPVRYAHGPYLAGYALSAFALAWSAPDRLTNLFALAAVIALALVSHVWVHYGHHHTYTDFVRFVWRKPGTVPQRAGGTVFLFVAAYALPIWLAQLLAHYGVALAWRGLGLALAAPIYVAFGLAARRVKREYTWPLYSAGYALTALGAMVSFENQVLAIYVLALNAVVYAASAYIFRQPFWLYLSNALVPAIALITLHYNALLIAPWVATVLMALAFVYFALGQAFDRRGGSAAGRAVASSALPFYAPGYLLSAAALAVASADTFLALRVYGAGVLLYALSAWAFRESVFLYPAAWLAAVPYYLAMTLTPLPPQWYGLGWLPLIVGYIALGRLVFHRRPLDPPSRQNLLAFLTHPAMPFYLLAYGLSVSMMVLSQRNPLTFTLALAAGAVVYFASAALFRRSFWLYPGLLAVHLALLSALTIRPSGRPAYFATLPFLGLTWLVAAAGYVFSRLRPVPLRRVSGRSLFKFGRWELGLGYFPALGYLLTPSWAQPFFLFAALDVVLWQALALYGFETGIILAVGHMALLGLLAMFWLDTVLAYGTLGFLLLALGYRLAWAGLPFADAMAWFGGVGLGLYFVVRLLEVIRARLDERRAAAWSLAVWIRPLTLAAIGLTALAVLATLPTIAARTTSAAAALAFAGAMYLAISYRGRYYRLGYLAMAMLQLAWALALIVRDVRQPQWYALPGGLYFVGMGYLERRRGSGLFAVGIESFGLAVLLLTAFIQSLDGGAEGFPYFVLLLIEALLAVWWGAANRLKAPFFIGLGASVLNVIGQLVILFLGPSTLIRWLIIGGAGLLIVTVAVFVERQRERILSRAREWRDELERWE